MQQKNREKTDSVTHLVKQIADEVAEEKVESRYADFESELTELKDEINDLKTQVVGTASQQVEAVRDACRAGEPWALQEEHQLKQEIKAAMQQIARNHQRSPTAIKERLKKIDFFGQF